jgi:hypothetical protein
MEGGKAMANQGIAATGAALKNTAYKVFYLKICVT